MLSSSSISSMGAHSKWMDANANNIANVNSDRFKSSDTKIEENGNSNPQAILRENKTSAANERSNTDLAKELTEQIPIEKGFGVNAAVVKTKDEMLGTLMDIKS